jgi:hypothetical protein
VVAHAVSGAGRQPAADGYLMRQALAFNARRVSVAQQWTTPATYGGWDTESGIAEMPITNAIALDNFFPDPGKVRLRNGHTEHATGMDARVESLMDYASGTATKLLAASGAEIHDISSSGAVGAALQSGLTNARFQHCNMGTSGGQFLLMFNGADAPLKYDGSTVSSAGITGPSSPENLIQACVFKRRVFMAEENSLKFWYLAVDSIAGVAASFDLAPLCGDGGYLMAIGTWTRDGGDGQDDVIVFITSRGQVVIYAGDDPADSSAWGLIGVFRVGSPVGRRCMVKIGSDLVIITRDAFIPMSQFLMSGRSNQNSALSKKIARAVTEATALYGSNFGWQPLLYPSGNMGLFNVPLSATVSHQYVMNTIHGAWCRFTGLNAACWAVYNDQLYFGGASGKVYRADNGTDDNGLTIQAEVKQAYSYFRDAGRIKKWNLCRPLLRSNGSLPVQIGMDVDFGDSGALATQAYDAGGASVWDSALWGSAVWGGSDQIQKYWRSVGRMGHAGSFRMAVNMKGATMDWSATNWVYEYGGQV